MAGPPLLLEHFLDVTDLALHLAAGLFGGAFVVQVGIVGGVANLLFDLARGLIHRAFDFVFGAFFHGIEGV